uniref:Uncharacterized protein n=1 Tax=Glossina austeni TaxID=7395 RepID=A0A1A9VQ66_GLOAU
MKGVVASKTLNPNIRALLAKFVVLAFRQDVLLLQQPVVICELLATDNSKQTSSSSNSSSSSSNSSDSSSHANASRPLHIAYLMLICCKRLKAVIGMDCAPHWIVIPLGSVLCSAVDVVCFLLARTVGEPREINGELVGME